MSAAFIEQLKSYLLSRHLTDEKRAGFYLSWVIRFYKFCNKNPEDSIGTEDIERYLKHLSKGHEEWQVKQASEAINLYLFFKDRKNTTHSKE